MRANRPTRFGLDLLAISPRFWIARQVLIAIYAVPLTGGALAAALLLPAAAAWALPGAVLALVGAVWAVELGRYRSWGYLERDDDLIVSRGIMFRRISVVPYGRMQFIDVSAGPVDRIFGLATVQLHTAAAATDARIPGLARRDADSLRDRLTALGEARATGL